jgi:hypothetical protein
VQTPNPYSNDADRGLRRHVVLCLPTIGPGEKLPQPFPIHGFLRPRARCRGAQRSLNASTRRGFAKSPQFAMIQPRNLPSRQTVRFCTHQCRRGRRSDYVKAIRAFCEGTLRPDIILETATEMLTGGVALVSQKRASTIYLGEER